MVTAAKESYSVMGPRVASSLNTIVDERAETLANFNFNREVIVSTLRDEGETENDWLIELDYGYKGPEEDVTIEFFVMDYDTCNNRILNSPITLDSVKIESKKESFLVVANMDVEEAIQRPELLLLKASLDRSNMADHVVGFCVYVEIHYQGHFVKFHRTQLTIDLLLEVDLDMIGSYNGREVPKVVEMAEEVASNVTMGENSTSTTGGEEDMGDSLDQAATEEEETPTEEEEETSGQQPDIGVPPDEFGDLIDDGMSPTGTEDDNLLPIILCTLGAVAVLLAGLCMLYVEIQRRARERKDMLNNFMDLEDPTSSHVDGSGSANHSHPVHGQQEELIHNFFEGSGAEIDPDNIEVAMDDLPPVLEEGMPEEVPHQSDVASVAVSGLTTTAGSRSMATGRWKAPGVLGGSHNMHRTDVRRFNYYNVKGKQDNIKSPNMEIMVSPLEDDDDASSRRLARKKVAKKAEYVENDSGVFLGTDAASVASHASRTSRRSTTSRRSKASKKGQKGQLIENNDGVFLGTDAASVVSHASRRSKASKASKAQNEVTV